MAQYPMEALNIGRKLYRKHDPWLYGYMKNMPKHYQEFHKLWEKGPQLHIHSKPNSHRFEKDEFGEIYPVQNPRVYVIYPDKFHEGLWGGEGVIKGLKLREDGNHRNMTPPPAKYWWPTLFQGVVYSEILARHLELVMTKRGARLVDEAKGFDSYLLSTPVNEVYATGLLRIKRELLLRLLDKDDFVKRSPGSSSVYDKFCGYAVSPEEADWHGLTISEAMRKQAALERRQAEEARVPSKHSYRRELLSLLKEGGEELMLEMKEQEQGGGVRALLGLKS